MEAEILRVMGPVIKNNRRIYTFLHRLITNAPDGSEVDHINGDTLDNRKVNLAVTDKFGNMQNRQSAEVRSKSGIRNVSWDNKKQKWVVFIKINHKSKYIGQYEKIEDAEKAAKQARGQYMPHSKEGLISARN